MAITLAFDVYGTLIDTHGVTAALRPHAGDRAADFSRAWREKQLEYSFRRGLMRSYRNFAACTADALDFTAAQFGIPLAREDREKLLGAYRALPAFGDVKDGLARCRAAGFRMFAFSNGTADAVEALLANAGIRDLFVDVVSVDEIRTFKPDPATYQHFLKRAGAAAAEAWLVSSNPFDVLGALSAGMRAAWIRRSPEAQFDPWGVEPTLTAKGLLDLAAQIDESTGKS
jgi:2-haloacid dehalogenase